MSFYGMVFIGSLLSMCSVYLLCNQSYDNPLKVETQPMSATERILEFDKLDELKDINDSSDALNEIQQVLEMQRRLIREEMIDYQYSNGSRLDDLVLEKGGRPVRSIVLSTWRSGSSFFGDILAAHPADFHHFEPLLDFGTVQIREPPLAAKALKSLRAQLNCQYTDQYIEFRRERSLLFFGIERLLKTCKAHESICYDRRFLSGMCKLFPFHSVKLVRLRLRVAQELLADERLAIRLVLLVRDPRGTFQSRKNRGFCLKSPECLDTALLCADMVSDYDVAVKLQKKYPTRFRVMRYEDLSLGPYEHADELTKFYGLNFHPSIKNYLDTHTTKDAGDAYSTIRDSKKAALHWRSDLDFEEVEEIQRLCGLAMNRWGYIPAMNETHQREFDPLTNYTLDL